MKDYERMSDFEINKAVAVAIWYQCYYGDGTYTNGMCGSSVIVSSKKRIGEFNPCNNPSDAWPIIFEKGISVMKHGNANEWEAGVDPVSGDGYCIYTDLTVYDKNPLRAAMIVFLIMMENKK